MVEGDSESFKGVADHHVVVVHDRLRRAALLHGLDGDGCAMFIRPTDKDDVLTLGTRIAHEDIRRQVSSCEMANVQRAICIRQRGSDCTPFELLAFHLAKINFLMRQDSEFTGRGRGFQRDCHCTMPS
jgi:hypothetical protein